MREKLELKTDTIEDGVRMRVFQMGKTEVIVEGELDIKAYAESVIYLVDTYLDPPTSDFQKKDIEREI